MADLACLIYWDWVLGFDAFLACLIEVEVQLEVFLISIIFAAVKMFVM